jgi:hypothetical protein
VTRVRDDQLRAGWLAKTDDGVYSVSDADKPFNPFARLVTGKLTSTYKDLLQASGLGEYSHRFMVAKNRPELDAQWESKDSEWVGKASMSKHHQFLLLRSLEWTTFNVSTFGMELFSPIDDSVLSMKPPLDFEPEQCVNEVSYVRSSWANRFRAKNKQPPFQANLTC